MRRYTAVLLPDAEQGGYTVRVPALPGCITEGDTLEEALVNAREAISLYLEALEELGRPAPEERLPPEVVTIEV